MTCCSRINLSFKNNERDQKLLTIINSKNDKSAFIKDCIEFYLSYNSVDNTVNNSIDNSVKTNKKRKVKF